MSRTLNGQRKNRVTVNVLRLLERKQEGGNESEGQVIKLKWRVEEEGFSDKVRMEGIWQGHKRRHITNDRASREWNWAGIIS